jgi:enoyl-CoA hydratase
VDAETAERWGLATRLVPEGEALDRAVELGERIAEFPQETVLTDRAAVYDGVGTPLQQGIGLEGWHGSRAIRTGREGADRFARGEGRGGEGIGGPEP